MASDRRRDIATAGVGYGLTAGSAVAQEAANRRAFTVTGTKPRAFRPKALVHLKRGGRAMRGPRALFAAGGAAGIVGVTGAGVGTYRLVHPRRNDQVGKRLNRTRDFVATGLQGTGDAFKERAQNTKENPDPRSRVLPMAVGAGAGAGGSQLGHKLIDRREKRLGRELHWTKRPAVTRPASVLAATLVGIPVANAVNRHVLHNNYVATPTGVQRQRKAYRPPSSSASVFDQKKMGGRRYREATVGKVHNPHNLTHVTHRGTPRKVHWRRDDTMSGVCGLDGAFGRGTGPFAEHYGEVTCEGCKRMMSIRKADDQDYDKRKAASQRAYEREMQWRASARTQFSRRLRSTRATGMGAGLGIGASALAGSSTGAAGLLSQMSRRRRLAESLAAQKKVVSEREREASRKGGQAAQEVLRERRTGQHRALQAMQRYHVNKADLTSQQMYRRATPAQRKVLRQKAQRDTSVMSAMASGSALAGVGYTLAHDAERRHTNNAIYNAQRVLANRNRPTVARDRAVQGKINLHNAKRARRIKRVSGGTAVGLFGGAIGYGVLANHQQVRRMRTMTKENEALSKAVGDDTPENYLGRRISGRKQRGAIYAAGAAPMGIGPIAAAKTAARFAPPGRERQAAARQYLGSGVAPIAAGIGGAYGAAHLANSNPAVQRAAERIHSASNTAQRKVKTTLGFNPDKPMGRVGRFKAGMKTRALESKTGVAMSRSLKGKLLAGGVGYVGAKALVGQVTGNVAVSRNLAEQRRYNLKHPVTKSVTPVAMSPKQQQRLARRKRINAATSTGTGLLGLSAVGLLAAGKHPKFRHLEPHLEHKRNAILAVGAGVGGAGNLNFGGIQRKEAKAEQKAIKTKINKAVPLPKGFLVEIQGGEKHMVRTGGSRVWRRDPVVPTGQRFVQSQLKSKAGKVNRGFIASRKEVEDHRATYLPMPSVTVHPISRHAWQEVGKDQPLTRMRHDQAARIVAQYGDKGPLPKELGRSERMTAYEARYVHAGGPKGEKWQRRADVADKVKTGGLAGATAAGMGYLALKAPKIRRMAGKVHVARESMGTAGLAAATVGGAGELYAGHARRKRSSYSNAPAGVAASALRRMRDYTPG